MVFVVNLGLFNRATMNTAELLKNKGIKKTAQRIMLIGILQKKAMPLTENDIKTEMGELYDRITFYRTAQVLIQAGIIHKITVDNITKYILNDLHFPGEKKDHAHFFCKNCHSITCLDHHLPMEYKLPEGFRVDECEIVLKGTCPDCSQSMNP